MSSPPIPASFAGTLQLPHGRHVSYIKVMSTRCLHCQAYLQPNETFIALGGPYHGALHEGCAPFYSYPLAWPHAHVAANYQSTSYPSLQSLQ